MNHHDLIKGLALLSQIGLTFVVCIALGFFGGRWLDGFLDTSPWFLMLGIILGIASAFKAVFDLLPK
ncbi:MAG: AtpZ/AtpI family protein [Oscillospiraceae bacterium]|nr:AtpZ/AtpI family protein [Oscillospiraceae bacterium]